MHTSSHQLKLTNQKAVQVKDDVCNSVFSLLLHARPLGAEYSYVLALCSDGLSALMQVVPPKRAQLVISLQLATVLGVLITCMRGVNIIISYIVIVIYIIQYKMMK